MGKVSIDKTHRYISAVRHTFAISPLLQEVILRCSQELPFSRASFLINALLPQAAVNGSQNQRLVNYIGSLPSVEEALRQPGFSLAEALPEGSEVPEEPIICLEVDGGHILTDDGYRETKVGRIFALHHRERRSSDDPDVDVRHALLRSDYIAHLGNHEEFTKRFGALVEAHCNAHPNTHLLAVSDGAEWIANWLEKRFPKATVILDFYHALEHLTKFAHRVFSCPQKREVWVKKCTTDLLAGNVENVIAAVTMRTRRRSASIVEQGNRLKAYYQKNRYRMRYDVYRRLGYPIGSGAIESAISTLVQQRCKLVGQRWSKQVATVLNIRSLFKSNKIKPLRNIILQQMGYKTAA